MTTGWLTGIQAIPHLLEPRPGRPCGMHIVSNRLNLPALYSTHPDC